jgi:methanethiol S-methyltransferase
MFWFVITITVWGMMHSLLASMRFKNFFRQAFGDGFMKFYRLLYNLFAVTSITPVLYLMFTLPNKTLYQVPAPWSYLMLAGQALSFLFLFVGIIQFDVFFFAGLRQLIEDEKRGNLVTTGLYRSVRHPLYTFALLILWLSPSMSLNSFIVYSSLTIYILIGIYFEERKLLREFGQQYAEYKSRTPMLLPSLKLGGNK